MKKKFPYLEVTGSHRDLGAAIGEQFRNKILESVSWRKDNIPGYRELRKISQRYFLETLHYFPKYIEELTAMAIAANAGLMDLFFTNTRSLYDSGILSEKGELIIHDRCTTVVSPGRDGVIVGHNEDWDLENIEDLYILKAKIGDTSFIGINYINELPGTSASMNNWGLVQGINEVHQKETLGIPKNFLARAVLQCKTLEEAEALIREAKQDTGFNHVLIQGDRVKNIEIAGGVTNTFDIKGKSYVHTNHFLSELKNYETYHTKSSEHRYSKATSLAKENMTEDEVIKLLSDHTDEKYPICRHDSTLATLIFEPAKGQVKIGYGAPCMADFTTYSV